MPKFLLHHPDGSTVKFGLNGKVFTIGRAENNDIVLRDGSSSSYHAVMKITDCGDFAISDLESTNHTKVNGQIVTTLTLMNGDVIQMGESRAVYESDIPSEGRVREDQPTQVYERPRPPASTPGMPVIVNQPTRSGVPATPAPAPGAAQPYVIQRPVSTMSSGGSRRSSQGDGCFALIVLAFVLPLVFFIGLSVRHYQEHDKQWFWDYVRDYLSAE
jgi:pSer/pThr/pTyr-binding forkhead associated (FHA) protein